MDEWKKHLETCAVSDVRTEIAKGIPWIEILERAEAKPPSLIVIGSRGKSLISRMFLGSQTENVLHHARVPVLILRVAVLKEGDPSSCTITKGIFRRILYLTDFSEEAGRYIPFLEWMAGAKPEPLVILHVQDTRRLGTASRGEIEAFNRNDAERLTALKHRFETFSIPEKRACTGTAAQGCGAEHGLSPF